MWKLRILSESYVWAPRQGKKALLFNYDDKNRSFFGDALFGAAFYNISYGKFSSSLAKNQIPNKDDCFIDLFHISTGFSCLFACLYDCI